MLTKILITIGVCAISCMNMTGQEKTMIDKRDQAEKNTAKFDPNYWKNEDDQHLAFLIKYMQDLNEKTIIATSHTPELVNSFCDKSIQIKNGLIEKEEKL